MRCSVEQWYRMYKLANNIKGLFNSNRKRVSNLITLDYTYIKEWYFSTVIWWENISRYVCLFIAQMHCRVYVMLENAAESYCLHLIWSAKFCLMWYFFPWKNIQDGRGSICSYIFSISFSSEVTKARSIFTWHLTQPLSSSHRRFAETME